MKRILTSLALLLAAAPAMAATPVAPQLQTITYAKFGKVQLLRPAGPPNNVVLFLSGEGGWTPAAAALAQTLVARGAVVAGVDTPYFLAQLRRNDSGCNYPTWDLEDLSHRVEKEIGFQQFVTPMLVGQGSGAALAYAALVQAPPGTFSGAISMGFCPEQSFGGAALCPGPAAGLHTFKGRGEALVLDPAPVLKDKWIALQPPQEPACSSHDIADFASRVGNAELVKLASLSNSGAQLLVAYDKLQSANVARRLPMSSSSDDVDDLPVTEVPTTVHSRRIVLLITGDGGWAALDKEVAAALAARGVPVVGLNALKYFWGERTPQATANDVARILRHYLTSWQASEILLVGYSFGADVMPFIINRLPADLRARIVSATYLSLSDKASFEVHMAGWMGAAPANGLPILPELQQIKGLPMLCLSGAGDDEAACDQYKGPGYVAQTLGEGHHFSARFAEIADRLLAFSIR